MIKYNYLGKKIGFKNTKSMSKMMMKNQKMTMKKKATN